MAELSGRGRVVKDTEWLTIYEQETGDFLYESKFLVSSLEIPAESIKRRWKAFSESDRYYFALAFQAKPSLTPNDEEILDFLMEVGNHTIWVTISSLLPRHTDRKRILEFLLQRIQSEERPKANFYQALELLRDQRAIPLLKNEYLMLKQLENTKLTDELTEEEFLKYVDFLQCCKTLLRIEGSEEYRRVLRQFMAAPNRRVADWSKIMLAQAQ